MALLSKVHSCLTVVGNAPIGDAHIVGYGVQRCGLSEMDPKVLGASATIAATSTNVTRNFHHGRRTSSTMTGRFTTHDLTAGDPTRAALLFPTHPTVPFFRFFCSLGYGLSLVCHIAFLSDGVKNSAAHSGGRRHIVTNDFEIRRKSGLVRNKTKY